MPMCWVKAGICGQETSIETLKTGPTTVAVTFATTCEHVEQLAADLPSIDVATEMTLPMNQTATYSAAAKHMCRTSCVVPAAVLKSVEAAAGIFQPDGCVIEFVDGAI